MQLKESWACDAGRYLGRLRRAMPMQVYIYICWKLKLSGNANLRLYQCLFAFTHRSPIKNFASCRLREKNFASLRLRKNLVELRARLSLLVDKTTFQYSVLTIYYTTIDGHAPFSPSQRSQPWRKGTPWMRWTIHQRPQPRGKGTPWTRRVIHQHRQPWRKGRSGRGGSPPPPRPPWDGRKRGSRTRRITTPAPAAMVEGDALDAPDHPQRQHAAGADLFICISSRDTCTSFRA